MKRVLLATASLFAIGSVAMAADLPTAKGPPPAPIAFVPAFTWTGFYVGLNAGYSWNNNDLTYGFQTFDWWTGNDIWTGYPRSADVNSDGFTGGAQAGYNYQFGAFVVGEEADIQYVDGQKTWNYANSGTFGPGPLVPGPLVGEDYTLALTAKSGIDWLGTLRARVGYAADRFLIYATGGLAFGNSDSSATILGTTTGAAGGAAGSGRTYFANWNGSDSDTSVGYAIGGGVEYAFTDNWTVKAEYLYYNLGSNTYQPLGYWNEGDGNISNRVPSIKSEIDGSLLRLGVNYKF
jgi:outer membrane immunogenic protein